MRGEMHDRIDPAQRSRQCICVAHIAPQQFESIGKDGVPGGKIVINQNLVPTTAQSAGGVTSDISGSSYDQNDQVIFSSFEADQILGISQRSRSERATSKLRIHSLTVVKFFS
jgi:hypothetical protein